jgi:hypothetical protein
MRKGLKRVKPLQENINLTVDELPEMPGQFSTDL